MFEFIGTPLSWEDAKPFLKVGPGVACVVLGGS